MIYFYISDTTLFMRSHDFVPRIRGTKSWLVRVRADPFLQNRGPPRHTGRHRHAWRERSWHASAGLLHPRYRSPLVQQKRVSQQAGHNPSKLWSPSCGHPGWRGGIDRAGFLRLDLAIVHGSLLYRIRYNSLTKRSRFLFSFMFGVTDPAWSIFTFFPEPL